MNRADRDDQRRDHGAVLPLVLVFIIVLGLVLAALARYTATNLRYSTVVEARAEASASAEAALRYAIQRVEANAVTTCDGGPVRLAPTHDTASDAFLSSADEIEITCSRLDSGPATLSDWAAVITADGIASANDLEIRTPPVVPSPPPIERVTTGRVFMPSLGQSDLRINYDDVVFDGNLFYDGSSDDCTTIASYDQSSSSWDDDIVVENGSFVCWPQAWDEVVDEPPLATLPEHVPGNPAWTTVGSCRVFEPGWYHDLDLDVGGGNYFRSGAYVFEDMQINTSVNPLSGMSASGTTIIAGYSDDASLDARLVADTTCDAARALDALDGPAPLNPGTNGVTWYFVGNTQLTIDADTTIEMIPMLIDDGIQSQAVSIHVLNAPAPCSFDPVYSVCATTLADGVPAVRHGSGPASRALFQGQIWSPTQPVDLYDVTGDSNGQITSGVVAAQLLVDSTSGSVGTLGPDRTRADHELLLDATATVDGVVVEARAVVEHRPAAPAGSRVAVRSIRIVD